MASDVDLKATALSQQTAVVEESGAEQLDHALCSDETVMEPVLVKVVGK